MEYVMGENRYAALKSGFPDQTEALYEKTFGRARGRCAQYRRIVDAEL